jgi:AraC-like DNA-binding protein
MFKRQLESLAATAPDDFVQRVESVIRVAIPKGEISLTSAAKSLALSTRSLQRKLQEQGTSFHEMVDTSRRQVAEHYISNSNLQLSQITELLGFTRLSNLTHAFKRWHGMSPSEWKKSQLELPR